MTEPALCADPRQCLKREASGFQLYFAMRAKASAKQESDERKIQLRYRRRVAVFAFAAVLTLVVISSIRCD